MNLMKTLTGRFLSPDKVPGGSIVAVHWDVRQVTKDHIKLATLLPEKVVMIIIIAIVVFVMTKSYNSQHQSHLSLNYLVFLYFVF